ncbi:MAG: metallophosphoesterase family protein [Pyrinomonadaceae bacterium]
MRRIVHISDIHFGAVDPFIVDRVIGSINDIAPDVLVVSGDLTQRARSWQFKEARAFLDKLPKPQIVVPGNHDVPLYNVFARFYQGLEKFQKYVTDDLSPTFIDQELAIVGVNTARSLTFKGGRINMDQIEHVRSTMCDLPEGILKIVVTHHPFDLPEGFNEDDIVGRAEHAMPLLADCGADVFLSGHLHVSNMETTTKRYKLESGRIALIIQAGTATSTRVRGEPHSFNVLEFESPIMQVKRLECRDPSTGFVIASEKIYRQGPVGWKQVE